MQLSLNLFRNDRKFKYNSWLCVSSNDPFVAFNKEKLILLAQFYPNDLSTVQLITLDH